MAFQGTVDVVHRQDEFVVCIPPDWGAQVAFGEPRDQDDCTYRLPLATKQQLSYTATREEIRSCDGRDIVDEETTRFRVTLTLDLVPTAIDVGGALCFALGAVASPVAVSASNAVHRIAIVADGGTFRLRYIGYDTAPIAYNAAFGAYDAALEALAKIGAAGVVASGAGPVDITWSGTAFAGKNIDLLEGLKAGLTGTGKAVTITEQTAGGPARTKHTITRLASFQGPALTAAVGLESGDVVLFEDGVAATLEIAQSDTGAYSCQIVFEGWSYLVPLEDFDVPECADIRPLKAKYGQVLFGAVNMNALVKAWGFTIDNQLAIDSGYTAASPRATRMETATFRQFGFTFQITGAPTDENFLAAMADFGQGTIADVKVRMGPASDGVVIGGPETKIRIPDGELATASGPENELSLPLTGQPRKLTAGATKPVYAEVVNQQSGDYLATS